MGQAPRLRLLQTLLRCCQDPDAEVLDAYCSGVRMSYLQRMPRTPAIFNEKERWRLRYEDPGVSAAPWAPNYKTARERAGFLEKKIAEDIGCGRMKSINHKVAKELYGDRLLLGPMGVIEEGADQLRLVHDGSHSTLIIHRIRPRDHVPGALVEDIAAVFKDAEDGQENSSASSGTLFQLTELGRCTHRTGDYKHALWLI